MWLDLVLERHARRTPHQVALRDVRRSLTWAELRAEVVGLAAAIARAAPVGARVAILSGNRVEMLELYAACARHGRIAVPVNPSLTDSEIDGILTGVTPTLLVADAGARERLVGRWSDVEVWAIECLAERAAAAVPVGESMAGLDTPVAILHTSATTGRPKGVVVDQRAFQANAFAWAIDVGAGPRTSFLNACPLFHGSLVIALDYLAAGATVNVLDRFTPQECLAALQTWEVSDVFLVPAMVRLILETRALCQTDLGALRLLLHGAAPMPAELAAAAVDRLGVAMQTIFGITEGGGPVLTLRPDEKVSTAPVAGATCAGAPMLGTEVAVRGLDGGLCEIGEIGEMHLRGDGLLRGYWCDPEATQAAVVDGWLNTHDLVLRDDQGYVWAVDRRNDLILRGGQNVYPAEIEHCLRSVPDVADVAVVPRESAVWGQTPVAFVQVTAGGDVTELDLLDACVARLASYKRPSAFLFVDQIPRSAAGKILRSQLRERAAHLSDRKSQ